MRFPFWHGGAEPPASPGPAVPRRGPRIAFALGAGAARGWALIGVMQEFAALGLVPD
ncbi:MAG: hypothetical protein INR64_19420, partial [Caulobacteraceae bacterium]|nr:hypothetical protein [Caulobacter sp.]